MQRTDTFQHVLKRIIAGIPGTAGRAITGTPRVSRPCFPAVWHSTSVARTGPGGVSGAPGARRARSSRQRPPGPVRNVVSVSVSVPEAVAITECRMVLEGLCAAKAAAAATADQAGQLAAIGENMMRAVREGEPLKYSALNRELHTLVHEMSGQAVAAELLQRLNAQIVRHQYRLSLRAGRPQVSLPEHLAIIEAITARDPAAAEAAARRHLRSVITALQESAQPAGQPATGR